MRDHPLPTYDCRLQIGVLEDVVVRRSSASHPGDISGRGVRLAVSLVGFAQMAQHQLAELGRGADVLLAAGLQVAYEDLDGHGPTLRFLLPGTHQKRDRSSLCRAQFVLEALRLPS